MRDTEGEELKMNEEKIIDESELDDLLEEAKGESTGTSVEEAKEPELELEPENHGEEEKEGIVLEVEPEPTLEDIKKQELEMKEKYAGKFISGRVPEDDLSIQPQQPIAIQPITPQTGLVAPVCSVQESVRIFKEFEKAKKEILSGKDVLWIGSDGRPAIEGEGSPHIKRSGWRKLARFFGLSWDIEKTEKLVMEQGGYMYKVRVKVWHPAGASVVSEGVATSQDAFFTKGGRQEAKEENIIMKAQTVAINRGVDDILGGGEVSAEELQ